MKHKNIICTLLSCLVSLFVVLPVFSQGLNLLASGQQAFSDLTATEASAMIDANPSLIIIDVREETEYCDDTADVDGPGHIPGALNYPWNSGVLQSSYNDFPADAQILFVCRSGNRSSQAAEFLCLNGYTQIYNMLGGMIAWEGNRSACADIDNDGIFDIADNCPDNCNTQQLDADNDGIGDVCDDTSGCGGCGQPACEVSCDIDNDGILNAEDNCPDNCNIGQSDADSDGIGDACDPDPNCSGCGQDPCEVECHTVVVDI